MLRGSSILSCEISGTIPSFVRNLIPAGVTVKRLCLDDIADASKANAPHNGEEPIHVAPFPYLMIGFLRSQHRRRNIIYEQSCFESSYKFLGFRSAKRVRQTLHLDIFRFRYRM